MACYNYNYDNVAIVYDLGLKHSLTFSSLHRCYVESIRLITPVEFQRRLSFLGHLKPGRYLKGYSKRCHYVDPLASVDLSRYILHMLYFKYSLKDITNGKSEEVVKNVNDCVALLVDIGIIEKKGDGMEIVRNEVLSYPLRPFLAKLLIEHSKDEIIINQLAYLIGLL